MTVLRHPRAVVSVPLTEPFPAHLLVALSASPGAGAWWLLSAPWVVPGAPLYFRFFSGATVVVSYYPTDAFRWDWESDAQRDRIRLGLPESFQPALHEWIV